MEVANTVAYYETAVITAVKSFIVQASDKLIAAIYRVIGPKILTDS
jgi:hypothetical protein